MSPTTREGGRRAPSRVALVLRSRTTQGFLFTAPLLALFAAFVIYPMAFGVWYALDADSYRALFSDPTFRQTVVNTLWYVGFAVNVKLFLAGRRAIPNELYEATAIDGASALQNFRYVTFPLLRNLYLICTLLSMVFTLGDFTVPWLLTGGAPGDSTHVLATLAYRYTFQMGRLEWGLATFAVALPVTLGFIGLLLRWVKI